MHISTLIYTSRAATPVTMKSLKHLAEVSARKNSLVGITGLLLFGSGNYFQVLEGNQTGIRIVYERIRLDKRHTSCEVLFEQQVERRMFPEWHMGQLNLDNADMGEKSDWEIVSTTLARSNSIDWQTDQPVMAWIREFVDHNGSGQSTSAA